MLYHMLLHEINGCGRRIVTDLGVRVHVENFVMRWGNFFLEPLHVLNSVFLYCFLSEKM